MNVCKLEKYHIRGGGLGMLPQGLGVCFPWRQLAVAISGKMNLLGLYRGCIV